MGQLQLYEYLGGKGRKFTKIMVLPGDPHSDIGKALKSFNIEVLLFNRSGKKVTIDESSLKTILHQALTWQGVRNVRPDNS